MSQPQRGYNIRMTPAMASACQRLSEEIPALPKSAILRALLADQFAKDISEQIAIVQRQLLKNPEKRERPRSGPGFNSGTALLKRSR